MGNKLPKNWISTTLGELATVQSGGTPSRGISSYWNGDIPWVKISDIKEMYVERTTEFITEEGLNNSSTRIFPKGTILFTIFATLGKIGILNIDAATNQAIAGITPSKVINDKYLTYSLIDLSNSISEFGKGVAQKNINQAILKDTIIPLPPLSEQNRIVDKLDRLFTQLETIKTSMAKVPLLLKNFRQQVLTQAVTGKLTEEWRKGKELEAWKEYSLSEFSDARLGKMLDGAKNSGELVNYLGNINIRWFNIDFSDLKQMKVESKELHKYKLLKGDILVCEGGEPGRAAIWKYDREDVIFQKALHRIRLNENVLPDFFLYNLKTDSTKNKLKELFTGTTIKHLTGRSFSLYSIFIPAVKEQQEIVNRVESLFAKADAIEQQYKSLKAKIDTLPQANLHKAFRGELSEQLDTDGDAAKLLEQVETLKSQSEIQSKKVKRGEKVIGVEI